ncbi:hypothetical protein C8Q78DRAFT_46645 [Trametes maxima]|nr:hypothetical protein C8Q78DRAFT_46645 [Trametes maxima]
MRISLFIGCMVFLAPAPQSQSRSQVRVLYLSRASKYPSIPLLSTRVHVSPVSARRIYVLKPHHRMHVYLLPLLSAANVCGRLRIDGCITRRSRLCTLLVVPPFSRGLGRGLHKVRACIPLPPTYDFILSPNPRPTRSAPRLLPLLSCRSSILSPSLRGASIKHRGPGPLLRHSTYYTRAYIRWVIRNLGVRIIT